MRTRRPLASPEWIADAEAAMDRKLGPARRGPKTKSDMNSAECPRNSPSGIPASKAVAFSIPPSACPR